MQNTEQQTKPCVIISQLPVSSERNNHRSALKKGMRTNAILNKRFKYCITVSCSLHNLKDKQWKYAKALYYAQRKDVKLREYIFSLFSFPVLPGMLVGIFFPLLFPTSGVPEVSGDLCGTCNLGLPSLEVSVGLVEALLPAHG